MLFEKRNTEVGVGVFLKRLDFDLFFEPLVGFVVLALAQINAAEIVEGTAIERIDFDLLLKGVYLDRKSVV